MMYNTLRGLIRDINGAKRYNTYLNTPEGAIRVVAARSRKGTFEVRTLHDGKWVAAAVKDIEFRR